MVVANSASSNGTDGAVGRDNGVVSGIFFSGNGFASDSGGGGDRGICAGIDWDIGVQPRIRR